MKELSLNKKIVWIEKLLPILFFNILHIHTIKLKRKKGFEIVVIYKSLDEEDSFEESNLKWEIRKSIETWFDHPVEDSDYFGFPKKETSEKINLTLIKLRI